MSYSNKWEATYRWLRHNLVLVAQQRCDTCKQLMELSPLGQGMKNDQRCFRCVSCLTRKSVREDSYLASMHSSMQLFLRVVFFYFVKGYEPELAHREMTENVENKAGCKVSLPGVYAFYA